MAQWVKDLEAKPHDMTVVPTVHMVGGENSLQTMSSDLQAHSRARTQACTRANGKTISKKEGLVTKGIEFSLPPEPSPCFATVLSLHGKLKTWLCLPSMMATKVLAA